MESMCKGSGGLPVHVCTVEVLISTTYSLSLLKTSQESKYALSSEYTGSWTCLPHVNKDKRQKSSDCSGKMYRCVMIQQSRSSGSEWTGGGGQVGGGAVTSFQPAQVTSSICCQWEMVWRRSPPTPPKKRIRRNTNKREGFRVKYFGTLNFRETLGSNGFKGGVWARYAEHSLLPHFQSIRDDLTPRPLCTNCTIIFRFLLLRWGDCCSKQNNALARATRASKQKLKAAVVSIIDAPIVVRHACAANADIWRGTELPTRTAASDTLFRCFWLLSPNTLFCAAVTLILIPPPAWNPFEVMKGTLKTGRPSQIAAEERATQQTDDELGRFNWRERRKSASGRCYQAHASAATGLTARSCKVVTDGWPWTRAPLTVRAPVSREATMKNRCAFTSRTTNTPMRLIFEFNFIQRAAARVLQAAAHTLLSALASRQTGSPFCFDRSPCKRFWITARPGNMPVCKHALTRLPPIRPWAALTSAFWVSDKATLVPCCFSPRKVLTKLSSK